MRRALREYAPVLLLALGLLAVPNTSAGQVLGSIAGNVKDTSGAVLPGVTVEAASAVLIEKVRTAVTDGSGQYSIINLPPGTYTITIVEGTGTRVVRCNKDTSFWVDRSKRRQVNLVGSLVDCRSGARVEIKYVGNDKEAALAEWVKIEVTSSE